MVGRGSIYLGTVSSSLIAFGFAAQSGIRLAPFVGAVLPVLFLLGELTFTALLHDSLQNIEFLRRMQRIRGHYRTLVPEAEEFFDAPDDDHEFAAEMGTVGLRRGPSTMLFTGASTIAVVNSILAGVGVALLLVASFGTEDSSATVVGVLSAVLLFTMHLSYESRRSTTTRMRPSGRTARLQA